MLTLEEIDKKIHDYQQRHYEDGFHLHNMYFLYTEDREGNVTSEAYGINLCTNFGFSKFIDTNYPWSGYSTIYSPFLKMHFGTGSTTPTLEDTTLASYVATATGYTYLNDRYTTDYDKLKKVIYTTVRLGYAYLNYEISETTEDVDLTEVGLSIDYSDQNNLMYRFLIRDENGNISYIRKHVGERLYIYIYGTWCMHENVILDGLSRGEYISFNPMTYTAATPMQFVEYRGEYSRSQYHYTNMNIRMNDRTWRHNNYDGHIESVPNGLLIHCNPVDTVSNNNEITYTMSMSPVLMEDPHDYIAGISGFYYGDTHTWDSINLQLLRACCTTYDKLPEPEEIICEDVYTNDFNTGRIDFQLGNTYDSANKRGAISVIDYNIQASYMFNIIDNDYTTPDTLTCNPDFQNINSLYDRINYPNFLCPDNIRRTIYIFPNPFTLTKIAKFTNTSVTIFGADKGWDISTWTQIQNTANVPDELSQKPYYVCYTDTVLNFEYIDSVYPKIIPATQDVKLGDSSLFQYDSVRVFVGDDDYNWFSMGAKIVMMNNDNTVKNVYPIPAHSEIASNLNCFQRSAYKNKMLCYSADVNQSALTELININQDGEPTGCGNVSFYPRLVNDALQYENVYRDHNDCNNPRYIISYYKNQNKSAYLIDMETYRGLTKSDVGTQVEYTIDTSSRGRFDPSDGVSIIDEEYVWYDWRYFYSPDFINVDEADFYISLQLSATGIRDNNTSVNIYIHMYDADGNFLRTSGPVPYQSYKNNIFEFRRDVRKIRISYHVRWDTPTSTTFTLTKYDFSNDATYLPEVVNPAFIKGTNYLVYTKMGDEFLSKWYIVDASNPETIIQTFTIEPEMVADSSWCGTVGFSHYIYIVINNSTSGTTTWLYDMNDGSLQHLVDMNYDFSPNVTELANSIPVANDKIFVFGGEPTKCIFADDPISIYTLTSNARGYTSLKYINNGKTLMLTSHIWRHMYNSGDNPHIWAVDIGPFIKDKSWKYGFPSERSYQYPHSSHGNGSYCLSILYPYKTGIIAFEDSHISYVQRLGNQPALYYHPIECFVPHKTIGTTKTITAYNNPIKLSGKTFTLVQTNNMTKLGLENDGAPLNPNEPA